MTSKLFRLLGAATLVAGLTFAQSSTTTTNPNPAPHPMARHRMARIANYLQLTDAQKTQAKAIFQAANEAGQPIREQLKPMRQQLQAAITSGNSAQIDQITAGMAPLKSQLAANRAKAFSKFYAILTPDQQTKLEAGMHRLMSGRMRPAGFRGHRGQSGSNVQQQ